MNFVKYCFDKIVYNKHIWKLFYRLIKHYFPKDLYNVGRDFTKKNQKRILLCYLSPIGIAPTNLKHAAYYHYNQMIHVLCKMGYNIDICHCTETHFPQRFNDYKYDIIIGQGPLYLDICKSHPNSKKILFCSENNPNVVKTNYKDRIEYFKQRHPKIKTSLATVRNQYFTNEHLTISDEIILINSQYNSQSFKPYFSRIFTINVNAMINSNFNPECLENTTKATRKNFVVFGCNGLIHKGIDILLDVFKDLPEYKLHIFGLSKSEIKLFNLLKSNNTNNCGYIDVLSKSFIRQVINKNTFVILPSCSEGMASGVASCMAHGLIPIVTRECGFNKCKYIIELEDYSIDAIKSQIQSLELIPNEELVKLRIGAMHYAKQQFSIEYFTQTFEKIIKEIN